MLITKRELFHIWRQERTIKQKNSAVLSYVLSKLGITDDVPEYVQSIKKEICRFTGKLRKRRLQERTSFTAFEKRYQKWMDECIPIPTQETLNYHKSNAVMKAVKCIKLEKLCTSELLLSDCEVGMLF